MYIEIYEFNCGSTDVTKLVVNSLTLKFTSQTNGHIENSNVVLAMRVGCYDDNITIHSWPTMVVGNNSFKNSHLS